MIWARKLECVTRGRGRGEYGAQVEASMGYMQT